jgi:hypothetical protein
MTLLSLFLFLTFSLPSGGGQVDSLQNKPLPRISRPVAIENKLDYEKGILSKKLDYQLVHGQKGKFILKFTNKPSQNIDIKIYDVIGNLIRTDKWKENEGNEREYDFSDRENKIYVVKVTAEQENVVKKINI